MFTTFRGLSAFRGLVWSVVVSLSAVAAAGELNVAFDVPRAIECRDVTTPEFAERAPGEKLVEARLPVSVAITGDIEQVREWSVTIVSPRDRLRVADYAPRTTLEAEYAEPICITKTDDDSRTYGATLSTAIPFGDVKASPGVNASHTGRDVLIETRKKLAPKRTVVSSGTLAGGHGVWFKIRPALETSLEGSREVIVRFRAPAAWQGDWVQVTFEESVVRTQFFKKSVETKQTHVDVGLYLAGSRNARQAAERLAASQRLKSAPPKPSLPTLFMPVTKSPSRTAEPTIGREEARSALARLAK